MAMWDGIGAGIPAAAREDGGEGPIAHVAAAGGEVAVDLVAVVNHVANRAPQAPAGCSQVTTEASTRGGEELPVCACAGSFQHGSEVRIPKVESVWQRSVDAVNQ